MKWIQYNVLSNVSYVTHNYVIILFHDNIFGNIIFESTISHVLCDIVDILIYVDTMIS